MCTQKNIFTGILLSREVKTHNSALKHREKNNNFPHFEVNLISVILPEKNIGLKYEEKKRS